MFWPVQRGSLDTVDFDKAIERFKKKLTELGHADGLKKLDKSLVRSKPLSPWVGCVLGPVE